ncbi:VOC family protein [Mucilaginibacter sp. BT774]|uniref:VOC family protein n=1 Tax=Mucilaginibacter sp. BT774 TaxID=3062276 RepID=UPI0026753F46|nr:VOC family protein [Mucilaginibacter sp. BT774]MDO3625462.1 VOC family protein [Mucilaginibacter sp. BT774]
MKVFTQTTFVPQFFVAKNGAEVVAFYKKAFDAIELRRFSNDDGTVHVSELEIGGALFHIHEEKPSARQYSPALCGGTTTIMGLMVADPDAVMEKAIAAGATVISPMQDYDYGYRQGDIRDPFGHQWVIEKVI